MFAAEKHFINVVRPQLSSLFPPTPAYPFSPFVPFLLSLARYLSLSLLAHTPFSLPPFPCAFRSISSSVCVFALRLFLLLSYYLSSLWTASLMLFSLRADLFLFPRREHAKREYFFAFARPTTTTTTRDVQSARICFV